MMIRSRSKTALLRRTLAAGVAAAALIAPPGTAQANVGVAAAVNTDAKGRPPGGAPRVISLGQSVIFNEEIITDGRGLVQILLLDGTTFTVGPNSQLTIDEFVYNPNTGDATVVATVAKGAFRFIGGQTSRKPGGATINTPVGTIGIRGAMVEGRIDSASQALFSMIFGDEVTFRGRDGTSSRLYQAGYTLTVAGGGGGLQTNVRRRTEGDAATFQTALASQDGQTGGTTNQPTEPIVQASPVVQVNSGLPTTAPIPSARPQAVQSTEIVEVEDQVADIGDVARDNTEDSTGITDDRTDPPPPPPPVTTAARLLTAPAIYTPINDTPITNPGPRGLVGSTPEADRVVELTKAGGRLVSADGSIDLPDLTGAQGDDEHLEEIQVTDGQAGEDSLTGTAYAGRGDFAVYFLGFNGNSANPFYLIHGTGTDLNTVNQGQALTNIRQYRLAPDPIRGGPVPFFAQDLYGPIGTYNSTKYFIVEPNLSTSGEYETFLTWLSIDGQGVNQKSAVLVDASSDFYDANEEQTLGGPRRGSFRSSATSGATNMRGGIGAVAGPDGKSFFGDNAEHFILGVDTDPVEAFYDRPVSSEFTGDAADGYLGDGRFGTIHVAELLRETPRSEFQRTTRAHFGFMVGVGESSADPANPYALTSDGGPNLFIDLDEASSNVFAAAVVHDSLDDDQVVDSLQLTFGAGGGASGGNTFVSDDIFGALHNRGNGTTRLMTDEGQDLAHAAGENPGSYLVSGRASPIGGYTHCEACGFVDWGWWGTRVSVNGNGTAELPSRRSEYVHMGTWVAGDITGDLSLPTNVRASYEGTLLGSVVRDLPNEREAQYIATGSFQMTYDFLLREGSMEATFDGVALSGGVVTSVESLSALFSGGWSQGEGGAFFAVDGAFVNDGADIAAGVIGSFTILDEGYGALGTLVGGRMSQTPIKQLQVRVLTAPELFTGVGQSLPAAGDRGLVGSTAEDDRIVALGQTGGRLIAADRSIDLPDFTGAEGDDGLESFAVGDATSPLGPLSGTVHAGAGDFAAYFLGANGDPTQPFYVIHGTPTDFSAFAAAAVHNDVRHYSLTEDPIRPGPVPFFSTELYGNVGTLSATDYMIVEPGTSGSEWRSFFSWLSIDGEGAEQKSATGVIVNGVFENAAGESRVAGGRRGSFRHASDAGPVIMRGALGSSGSGSGDHFFGDNLENFVIGAPLTPSDAFFDGLIGPGFTGDPADGYLGEGTFGTQHVANLETEVSKDTLSRTSRDREGYMAGSADSTELPIGALIPLTSDSNRNFSMSLDAVRSSMSARGTVEDTFDYRPVVDAYTLVFGSTATAYGASTFVDDDTFAATHNFNRSETQLLTDGGQVLSPNQNPGNYIVSGRATPITGYEHCLTCTFVDWGWWGTNVAIEGNGSEEVPAWRNDGVHLGTWVAGDITTQANMPANVSASFTGTALGNVYDERSGTQYIALGGVVMDYDFNARSGTIAITDYAGLDYAGVLGGDATLVDGNSHFIGALTGPGVERGALAGSFVDHGTDRAAGAIGNFLIESSVIDSVGTIVAGRTTLGGVAMTTRARVLTSPETFRTVSEPTDFPAAGSRGLVGSTPETDRRLDFAHFGDRLVAGAGLISLPDLTGAEGDSGLEPILVSDGQIGSDTASGWAYAGRGDFAAYMLGRDGDPTKPFYTIAGTGSSQAALETLFNGTNIREYTLTEDPIRPSALPFFANDLFGEPSTYSSTNLFVIESDVAEFVPEGQPNWNTKVFQSWVAIDGTGLDQKSAAQVLPATITDARGDPGDYEMLGARRGTFRYAALAGPANTRSAIGTIAGPDGTHFFGDGIDHFVLGAPIDPPSGPEGYSDSLLGPGFTGDPNDGYLGQPYPFSTHHVADLTGLASQESLSRTQRQVQGFISGMAESSAEGLGNPYVLAGVMPNFDLRIDPDFNSIGAVATLTDVFDASPVADGYQIGFGVANESGGDSAFLDDDRFGAANTVDRELTRLRTDGGQDLGHGSNSPGSYILSGKANPIEGFAHCTDCAFLDWGWWGTRVRVNGDGTEIVGQRSDFVHMGTWVAGDITNPADLPTNVTASYEGTALGNVARQTAGGVAKYIASGDMNMDFDFNSRTGSMQISNFDGMNLISELGDASTTSQALFSGGLSGSGVAGHVHGAFVNDGTDIAAGVIGNFAVSGTGVTATGTIAGTRTGTGPGL